MQTKINELGRSMVEVLGVLAIIGVLSVGGVATYQYALTAYQTGKVQDVLGKAKTLAQTDSRASHALEVNRFIKSALSEYVPDDKKSMVKLVNSNYQVTTFKVVYKVCKKLLQKESILNDMGISILTRTCGNPNSETNMVFSFNAIPVVNSDSHFGGTTETETDNPNIEPQSCPDKMAWRQKDDGTYGCVCRHAFEYGDNCERCYPPKEWFEDERTCRCPNWTPIWKDENCVECLTNDDCKNINPVCNINNFCESCPEGITVWDGNKCTCIPEKMPVGYNPDTCTCPIGYHSLSLLDETKKVCFPECNPESDTETGVILMVDKSNSTKNNSTVYKKIRNAIATLNIPQSTPIALYFDTAPSSTTHILGLPYGSTADQAYDVVYNQPYRGSAAGGTTFYHAFYDVINSICTPNKKILILIWTDATLLSSSLTIADIRNACHPESELYLMSNTTKTTAYLESIHYKFGTEEKMNSNILNYIQQHYCIKQE